VPAELDGPADDQGDRTDGLTSAERDELVRLRRELRVTKLEVEILKPAATHLAQQNVLPIICTFIAERSSGLPVAVCSRVIEGVDLRLVPSP
jgi:hypothetical protein